MSTPSSSDVSHQDSATIDHGVPAQSSHPPMKVIDESIQKCDDILEKIETGFAAYMSDLLKDTRMHLTEDSVKALFECAICQETIIETTFISCKHSFCNFCLSKWLKLNFNCPVCRQDAVVADRNKLVDGVVDVLVELSFSDEQKKERDKEIQQRRSAPVPAATEEAKSPDINDSSSDDDLENTLGHLRRNRRIYCVQRAVGVFVKFAREIIKRYPEKVKEMEKVMASGYNESLWAPHPLSDTFREDLTNFQSISQSYQSEYRWAALYC